MKIQIASALRRPIWNWAWTITLLLLTASSTISAQSVDDIATPFTPPDSITVTMRRLIFPGGGVTEDNCTLDPPDESWGCTWFDPDHYPSQNVRPYPYTSNPVTVPIETDYLLDVIPQEMGTYYHPTALQAQAIAARTYAYWHIDQGYAVNNSNSYHVFVPLKFESLPPATATITATEPCGLESLGTARELVCTAVAPRYYIAYGDSSDDDQPAFTEFTGDVFARTESNPADRAGTPSPYLLGVQDPISTACDANNYGHGHGMSQKGASRWARGRQCSYNGAQVLPGNPAGETWSVQWQHAEQILVHYYTGIHLWDANNTQLTGGYRWNPLSIDWHTLDNQPPTMQHGGAYSVSVQVQNTSIYYWPVSGQASFALSYHWAKLGFEEEPSLNRALATVQVPQGDPPYTFTLTLDDLPDWGPCPYWLKFDMLISWDGDYWFSQTYDWPTHDVGGTCEQLFIPLLLKNN